MAEERTLSRGLRLLLMVTNIQIVADSVMIAVSCEIWSQKPGPSVANSAENERMIIIRCN